MRELQREYKEDTEKTLEPEAAEDHTKLSALLRLKGGAEDNVIINLASAATSQAYRTLL